MFLLAANSSAEKIVHYEYVPFTVYLEVGKERSISFGDHVQVGMSKGLQVKKLFRHQSAQGVLHLLANEVFEKQRIQVRRMSDNRIIFIDLIGTDKDMGIETGESIRVLMPDENKAPSDSGSNGQKSPANSLFNYSTKKGITPVDLTRFAAQKLYGPKRLHKEDSRISPVNIPNHSGINIFKGKNKHVTYAKSVLGYQANGNYLTVILIKNMSPEEVNLSYLDLNIPFDYATFQHHKLGPKNTGTDNTVLYLISKQSMEETLFPWTYYLDERNKNQGGGK